MGRRTNNHPILTFVINSRALCQTVDTPGPTGVVTGSRHHQQQSPSYSRSHHPSAMHEKQPSDSYPTRHDDDDDDDNVCVAQLLNAKVKSASPRPSRSNTMKGYRSRDRSPVPNVSSLQRSASSGGSSTSRRHMHQPSNEPPVPPLPTQQQPTIDKDEEDLRAAVQCAWAVLESGNSDGAEKKQV